MIHMDETQDQYQDEEVKKTAVEKVMGIAKNQDVNISKVHGNA